MDWLSMQDDEIDKSTGDLELELFTLMRQWQTVKEQCDAIESRINEITGIMGKSMSIGRVKAQYTKPTEVRDYEGAAKAWVARFIEDHKPLPGHERELDHYGRVLDEHTTTRESVAWAKVCAALDIPIDEVPVIDTKPARVALKLID